MSTLPELQDATNKTDNGLSDKPRYFKMLTNEVEGDRIFETKESPEHEVHFMVTTETNPDGTFDVAIRHLKRTVGVALIDRGLTVVKHEDFTNLMNKALELVLIQKAKEQEMHQSVFFSIFDSYSSYEKYKTDIRKELVDRIENDYNQSQAVASEFLTQLDEETQKQIDNIREVRNSFTIGEVEALAFPYDKIEPMLGAINNLKQLLCTFNDLDLRYINSRLPRLSQRDQNHNHPVDMNKLGRTFNQNLNELVLPTFLDPALINQFPKMCNLIEEVIQSPKHRNAGLSAILVNCLTCLQSLFKIGLGNKLVLS